MYESQRQWLQQSIKMSLLSPSLCSCVQDVPQWQLCPQFLQFFMLILFILEVTAHVSCSPLWFANIFFIFNYWFANFFVIRRNSTIFNGFWARDKNKKRTDSKKSVFFLHFLYFLLAFYFELWYNIRIFRKETLWIHFLV